MWREYKSSLEHYLIFCFLEKYVMVNLVILYACYILRSDMFIWGPSVPWLTLDQRVNDASFLVLHALPGQACWNPAFQNILTDSFTCGGDISWIDGWKKKWEGRYLSLWRMWPVIAKCEESVNLQWNMIWFLVFWRSWWWWIW